MLISERITDLFGGVSQAPSAKRLANQWSELVNSLPIFGKRLGRRPPSLHIAKLSASSDPNAFVRSVETSSGLRAHLVVANGGIAAYDSTTGAPITVLAPDGTGYLLSGALKAAQNGDTTVLLNTSVAVAKSVTVAPAKKYEALIYVRQGDYETNYVVTLNGITFTYTTPAQATAGSLAATATDKITNAIIALIQANAGIAAQFYLQLYGSTIYVARKDGADFTISSADGIADKGLVLVKGAIQRFADLPPRCRPGVIVEVTGDDSTQFDNYYVQYLAATATDQRGVWVEVVKPGAALALDATTLPHSCTFRGNLMEELAHVDTRRLAGTIEAVGLGPSILEYHLTFPADALYPAGCPIAVVFGGVTTFTYTVGAIPESAATVAAGLKALINADPTYLITSLAPEQLDLKRADNGFFTVTTSCGFSNSTTFATLLPLRSLNGLTIKNLTDGSSGVITGTTAGTLVVAGLTGGSTNLFNDGDVCVVVAAGDYFLFSQAPWARRAVGDDITTPFPSVVGKKLNEVFFHQGRLGLVVADGTLLSRAGDLFNLFRGTATAVLSDDPIDITNALGDASPLHSAVEWNDKLYLFSGLKQYTLGGQNDGPITPTTVRLRAVSSYPNSALVRPVVAGDRIYFAAIKSGFTRILEYAIQGYEMRHSAEDTGLHCPTYIRGAPVHLAVDDTQGALLLLTDGLSQKSLYVYSYRREAGEKAAAGWHRWDFSSGTVVTMDSIEGSVALITAHSDGLFANLLLLDPIALAAYDNYYGDVGLLFGGFVYGDGDEAGGEKIAYLDRRVIQTTPGVTVAFAAGTTTWTLPYQVATDGSEGILTAALEHGGVILTTTRPAANQIAAVGDYSTAAVYIGLRYTTAWTFSTLYVRDGAGVVDERGRLQLRFLRLRYADTSNLTASVSLPGRTARLTTLNGAVASGTLVVPVQGRNDEATITVTNNTPGASNLVSYDWEGTFHTRERAL